MTPRNVLPFRNLRHCYQDALRRQQDCQRESAAASLEEKRTIVKMLLLDAIRHAYEQFDMGDACGVVTWAHNAVHTEYIKR